jgi:hypothetical protein
MNGRASVVFSKKCEVQNVTVTDPSHNSKIFNLFGKKDANQ